MARRILNDGDTYGTIRTAINSNFEELYAKAADFDALREEATAKWVILNEVETRSRQNTQSITDLAELIGVSNSVLQARLAGE